jgi:hypothetical protein
MGRPGLRAGCHLPRQPENIDCGGRSGRDRTHPNYDFCAYRKGASLWDAGFGGQLHAIQVATPSESDMATLKASTTAYATVHRLTPLGKSTFWEGFNKRRNKMNPKIPVFRCLWTISLALLTLIHRSYYSSESEGN